MNPTETKRAPKTLQDWQAVRRDNPRLYYTPKVQEQVVKDAQALGHSFYAKRKEDY